MGPGTVHDRTEITSGRSEAARLCLIQDWERAAQNHDLVGPEESTVRVASPAHRPWLASALQDFNVSGFPVVKFTRPVSTDKSDNEGPRWSRGQWVGWTGQARSTNIMQCLTARKGKLDPHGRGPRRTVSVRFDGGWMSLDALDAGGDTAEAGTTGTQGKGRSRSAAPSVNHSSAACSESNIRCLSPTRHVSCCSSHPAPLQEFHSWSSGCSCT